MNKKTIRLILVILALIISVIGFILSRRNDEEETLQNNEEIIKENYTLLSTNSVANIEIRKELLTKINTFNKDTYKEEHENYLKVISKYEENIKKIDDNVNNMESRCDHEYEDATINIFCRGYDTLYEEIINIYVKTITEYNNKITDYNKTTKESYSLHKMLHTEYIDFNEDGIYQGK